MSRVRLLSLPLAAALAITGAAGAGAQTPPTLTPGTIDDAAFGLLASAAVATAGAGTMTIAISGSGTLDVPGLAGALGPMGQMMMSSIVDAGTPEPVPVDFSGISGSAAIDLGAGACEIRLVDPALGMDLAIRMIGDETWVQAPAATGSDAWVLESDLPEDAATRAVPAPLQSAIVGLVAAIVAPIVLTQSEALSSAFGQMSDNLAAEIGGDGSADGTIYPADPEANPAMKSAVDMARSLAGSLAAAGVSITLGPDAPCAAGTCAQVIVSEGIPDMTALMVAMQGAGDGSAIGTIGTIDLTIAIDRATMRIDSIVLSHGLPLSPAGLTLAFGGYGEPVTVERP